MLKYQVSAKTATGDTVKTLIDTLTVPAKAKALVGVWAEAYCGAGMTTLENITGILELESDDINLQPMQLPLDAVVITGTGVGIVQPKVWPMNVPLNGGEKIKAYITMDLALTIANTARVGFVYDVQ